MELQTRFDSPLFFPIMNPAPWVAGRAQHLDHRNNHETSPSAGSQVDIHTPSTAIPVPWGCPAGGSKRWGLTVFLP